MAIKSFKILTIFTFNLILIASTFASDPGSGAAAPDFQKASAWTPELMTRCSKESNVDFHTSKPLLEEYSGDFGRLVKGDPAGVVFPTSAQQVQSIIKFANNNGLKLTLRAGGYSQGGQTIAPSGAVTLDCSKMTQIAVPNLKEGTIKVQAGATWRQVISATAMHKLIPVVTAFFPDLSVAGVLSVGGIGGNSHRFGTVNANVKELEVITGEGEHIICNHVRADIFNSVLSGIGRCGVIISATLKLKKYKQYVQTYYLTYDDYTSWFKAQGALAKGENFDYLESFCHPVSLGLHPVANGWGPLTKWIYSIQVSREFDSKEPLPFGCNPPILEDSTSDTIDFRMRYGARAAMMKESGNWKLPHPWFEIILSPKDMAKALPTILKMLPPVLVSDGLGYRVFGINNIHTPRSFMGSEHDTLMGFAILPGGVPEANFPAVLAALKDIDKYLKQFGGKRYISGFMGTSPDFSWQQYYGDYYQRWVALKRQLDPNNVLGSVLLDGSKPAPLRSAL